MLKRFGSRQGILLALSRRWAESIPEAPLGKNPPEVELRTWVEFRFSADGSGGVAQGLVNLLDDLMDDELRALLAEGWAKEIRYLAALLSQMNRPRDGDANRCAALLFDALNGAMLRRATEPTAPGPEQVLDHLLEVWT
ncbi:Uncharacterised protein [Kytococcus sedentarius]|nr:Uncharacterised protein [Kytococcus sedentarius]